MSVAAAWSPTHWRDRATPEIRCSLYICRISPPPPLLSIYLAKHSRADSACLKPPSLPAPPPRSPSPAQRCPPSRIWAPSELKALAAAHRRPAPAAAAAWGDVEDGDEYVFTMLAFRIDIVHKELDPAAAAAAAAVGLGETKGRRRCAMLRAEGREPEERRREA